MFFKKNRDLLNKSFWFVFPLLEPERLPKWKSKGGPVTRRLEAVGDGGMKNAQRASLTNQIPQGFTLIEILIVIAIIGVLAAIAIPQLSAYRTRGYNTSAMADLKNAAIAQEAYYTESQTYCSTLSVLTATPYNFFISPGVLLSIDSASSTAYTVTAYHRSGDVTYTLSGPGGLIVPLGVCRHFHSLYPAAGAHRWKRPLPSFCLTAPKAPMVCRARMLRFCIFYIKIMHLRWKASIRHDPALHHERASHRPVL